jgi:hypothetical protein
MVRGRLNPAKSRTRRIADLYAGTFEGRVRELVAADDAKHEHDAECKPLRPSPPVSPHNAKSPVDLQRTPRCYLCGGQWTLRGDLYYPKLAGSQIVECMGCELVTWARFDEAVWQMRGWR